MSLGNTVVRHADFSDAQTLCDLVSEKHCPSIFLAGLPWSQRARRASNDNLGWDVDFCSAALENSSLALICETESKGGRHDVRGIIGISASLDSEAFPSSLCSQWKWKTLKHGWPEFIHNAFAPGTNSSLGSKHLDKSNTFFLSFLVLCSDSTSSSVFREIMHTVYEILPLRVKYLALFSSAPAPYPFKSGYEMPETYCALAERGSVFNVPESESSDTQTSYFKQVYPKPGGDPESSCSAISAALFVTKRSHFEESMNVRRAIVEDCDHLLPLFTKHNMLQKNSTDFEVAQILESSQDGKVVSLVGEVDSYAIAFISASTAAVNLQLLKKVYNLDSFPDLSERTFLESSEKKVIDENSLNAEKTGESGSSTSCALNVATIKELKEIKHESPTDLLNTSMENVTKQKSSDTATDSTAQPNEAHRDSKSEESSTKKIDMPGAQVVVEGNVFAIKMFCIDKNYENQGFRLIKPLFDCFPNCDYALVSVPVTAPEFSMLKYFTRVPVRRNVFPPHMLYLAHRFGSFSKLTVNQATLTSLASLKNLLCSNNDVAKTNGPLQRAVKLIDTLGSSADWEFACSQLRCYLIETYGQIVGFAFLGLDGLCGLNISCEIERWCSLKHHVLLDKRLNSLKILFVNPLFEGQIQTVLQDLMNAVESNIITFETEDPVVDQMTTKHVCQYGIPMRPNSYSRGLSSRYKSHFILLASRYLYDCRTVVNERKVFVGASTCSLSAIADLIYSDNIWYTNLVLIDSETLQQSAYKPPKKCGNEDILDSDAVRMQGLFRLEAHGFGVHVDTVCGKVTGIDRDGCTLTLQNGQKIAYTQLIVSPGLCFLPYLGDTWVSNSQNSLRVGAPTISYSRFHRADLMKAISGVQKEICVVGSTPAAYFAVREIFMRMQDGANLYHLTSVPLYNDKKVQECYKTDYAKTGVQLFEFCQEISISPNERLDCQPQSEISFSYEDAGEIKQRKIVATLIVFAENRALCPDNFSILCDSNLVYDKGIVIGLDFSTCDPKIFSGGRACKYSVKCKFDVDFDSVSSIEVGQRLAQCIRSKLDTSYSKPSEKDLLKNYTMPTGSYTRFVGGTWFYLARARKARVNHTLKTMKQHTGPDGNGFRHLHLGFSQDGFLCEVMFIGTNDSPLAPQDLIRLIGLNESYFLHPRIQSDGHPVQDYCEYINEHLPPYVTELIRAAEAALETQLAPRFGEIQREAESKIKVNLSTFSAREIRETLHAEFLKDTAALKASQNVLNAFAHILQKKKGELHDASVDEQKRKDSCIAAQHL